MKIYFAAGVPAWIFSTSLAFAIGFPNHSDICVGGIVSREKLAKAVLKQDPDVSQLYIDASDAGTLPKWQRIFADKSFCVDDENCLRPSIDVKPKPGQKPPLDYSAAKKIVGRLRFDFDNALQTNVNGQHYRMANSKMGTDYFLPSNAGVQIACVGPELPSIPKPTVLKLPIRLRASSDDLGIDAGRDKDAFRAVKPATVSFARDGVQRLNTAKLQAALGYAFPLTVDLNKSPGIEFFNGEVVPYISATQTTSKVDGKPGTYADSNNIAVGALFNTQAVFSGWDGVNNVIMAKPQYLWNTKDRSEIASLNFIYQPWTSVLNTPQQIGDFIGASWLTLLFDLRNNTGQYTNVGIDPVAAATHKSFDRSGSRFGFAFATDTGGPHIVVSVTETMLYGFTGSVKLLDLFEATASYYFDSTSNFAFTVAYSKGRNEDTAERTQSILAGISAKF